MFTKIVLKKVVMDKSSPAFLHEIPVLDSPTSFHSDPLRGPLGNKFLLSRETPDTDTKSEMDWDPDNFVRPIIPGHGAGKVRRRKINSIECMPKCNKKGSLSFKMAKANENDDDDEENVSMKSAVKNTSDPMHKRDITIQYSAVGWRDRIQK